MRDLYKLLHRGEETNEHPPAIVRSGSSLTSFVTQWHKPMRRRRWTGLDGEESQYVSTLQVRDNIAASDPCVHVATSMIPGFSKSKTITRESANVRWIQSLVREERRPSLPIVNRPELLKSGMNTKYLVGLYRLCHVYWLKLGQSPRRILAQSKPSSRRFLKRGNIPKEEVKIEQLFL